MSFLSGLLTAVGIIGAVATGGALGIVAGAILATSFASQQGWLGGGAKSFFNSSLGKDITMATGLASAAEGVVSDLNAVSSVASTGAQAAGADAAAGADQTLSAAAQAGVDAGAAPTVSGAMANTMTDANSYISSLSSGDPTLNASSGLQASEIQAANKTADLNASTLGLSGVGGTPVSGTEATDVQTNLGINTTAQTQGAGVNATQSAVNAGGSTNDVTSATAIPTPTSPSADAQNSPNFNGAQGNGDVAKPGFLSQAANFVGKNPGVAAMAGQALSGVAQGISQQKVMQEQIAAQQWGNMQWEDPTQTAALQSAAAAPITVPVGYLNRAAAVRNLMNGSANQPGSVTGGAAPPAPGGAATAPAPTVAPVGMASNGPVPVVGMNATPRGGVI